MILGDTLRF